jgi:phosphoribosylformylglycinamidine cyclo-ligase
VTTHAAYARAGVDVAAGERAVELLSRWLGAGQGGAPGRFASVLEIPAGMRQPVIVSATDGVGTKTDIARRLGRLDTIGQDLVAMCADDVVCHGAAPAYFLDYLALGRLEPERVATLVSGIAQACAEIGCSLVGGETAEHPGLLAEDEFDMAGFCIGFAERDEVIGAGDSRPGDVIVGLASSGLHANGFSLIRRLVDGGELPLDDELLTPTHLYAPAVLELLSALRAEGLRAGGLAHITGGGLARNLPRAVGDDLGVLVHPSAWPPPAIFERVAKAAGLAGDEMRATFNCGIGFAVVLEPAAASPALELLRSHEIEAWVVGDVRPAGELGGRYAED